MRADATVPVEPDKSLKFGAKLRFPLSTALLAVFITVVCYFADWVGTTLILSWQTVSALWPGAAILVSVLLFVPRKAWPVLLPAGIAGFVLRNVRVGLNPGVIVILQSADTLGILVASLGLRRSFAGIPRLNSVKALGKYCFFTIALASFLSSFIGAAAVGDYWSNWAIWFLSHVLSFLTITPAILYWFSSPPVWARTPMKKRLEALAFTAALIVLGYLVFLVHWKPAPPALLYSFVPFLLWAALRFGATGVSSSTIIISFLAIWGALHGRGPFLGADPLHNILSLQLFLILAGTPFIFLGVLAEEREEAQEALSGVSRKLIEAHEQERTLIASELHDDVCQRLAMLCLRVEKTSKGWRDKHALVDDQLEKIRQQSADLARDVQALSHQLHPSTLDNLGLVAAVKSLCREISEHNDVVVDFSGGTLPPTLPREISIALFRVIQEGLHNSVKHSGGRHFEVRLQGSRSRIELEVSDRGAGFDASTTNRRGLGLVNMAERVHQVNGTFRIDSRPNVGTKIRVNVPVA
jgi:signal transduction histidine kinase